MSDLDVAAIELKQYTVNLLNSMRLEIAAQYDKWGKEHVGFVSLLCGAHGDAASDQAAILKQQQDEERRAFERAMFIFSIVGLFAIDVAGAAIELKLAPKLIGEYDKTRATAAGFTIIYSTRRAGVNRKVMGDFSTDLMQSLLALGTQYDGPPSTYRELDLASLPYSPNAKEFGHKLFVELDQQQAAIASYINGVSQSVFRSRVFGDNLVKRLVQTSEALNAVGKLISEKLGRKPDKNTLIEAGQLWIDSVFDDKRKKWADQYYFYGYDPSPKPNWEMIRRRLERYLWKLWIQQQHFRIRVNVGQDPGWIRASDTYSLIGASGSILERTGGIGSWIKDNPIVTRLYDLNAPVMDLTTGATWSHRSECQSQLDKLKTWAEQLDGADLQKEIDGIKRPFRTVSKIW
jgi:hypothetical protein